MERRRAWAAVAVVAAVAVAVASVAGWWLLRNDADPDPALAASPTTSPRTEPGPALVPEKGACAEEPGKPFTPRRIAIEGVVDSTEVIGMPRDALGVTGVLPISNKLGVAWDRAGIQPGSRRGNVLLNTHTWPDGSALGNLLLERLRKGDRIVLRGSDGARLCYRVTREVEVLASEGYPPYYETDGPPRVAIVVCSGTRDAAGEWSHRTIWFARPIS